MLVARVAGIIGAIIVANGNVPRGVADESRAQALFAWPHFFRLAHSHNDYEQKRPLLDAVEAGVSSIEVDLFLDRGEIMVAHDRGKWRGLFETLYLQPLTELWQRNRLPTNSAGSFLLWLDLKESGAALRSKLRQLLEKYPVAGNSPSARARVQIILTGDEVSKQAFVAESSDDSVSRDSNHFLEDDPPASLTWSWYALDWKKIGAWAGEGAMPVEERKRLHALVARIHAKQRRLRLWNHPATLIFWQEAHAAGVDRLGTDLLPRPKSKAGGF